MKTTMTAKVGENTITLETGWWAKQADGAIVARCGNNMVLVTAVSSQQEKPFDFFPLTVEYQEKFYATGKIPGGYFKREGKPTTHATLTARLIDRPIRPLCPEGYYYDTQIVATVLSSDGLFPVEVLASVAASAAMHISNIPFKGPIAAIQVGRVDGKLIANPSAKQIEASDMDVTIAGTRNGILMVEGEAKFISEADFLAALKFAHEAMVPLLEAQEELRKKLGKEKRPTKAAEINPEVRSGMEKEIFPKIKAALKTREKLARYEAFDAALVSAMDRFCAPVTDEKERATLEKQVKYLFEDMKYRGARGMILDEGTRIDGRDVKTVRPIWCEPAVLPRAHGSALFTRGETQVLGAVTLGTSDDEQEIDSLSGYVVRKFLLHYNFPPFSVGETGRMGGQSRRELGHGFLAERALQAIIPDHTKFPYTIRIVSEVLESNGSSSMGTVCSGAMALLDAGVPVKDYVAGIAMGLIKEDNRVAILSDILGDEDHLGDMDFKVAGSRKGITAIQMDLKIDGVSLQIMEKALAQAHVGRLHILAEMEKAIKEPRGEISPYAPRLEIMRIKPEKVREVIGSGGKVIRGIIEQTGVKIDIESDGTVHIFSADPEQTKKAVQIINDICAEAEVGKVYHGCRVVKIVDFGAFVEVLPNAQGLLHISEISHERIRQVTDVLNEGDMIDVKVLDIDRTGKMKLSRKAILQRENN